MFLSKIFVNDNLQYASKNGIFDKVLFHLQQGANVNQGTTDTGSTPLFYASQNGHHLVVELLLRHGAAVNKAKTDTGSTPLYAASQNGHRQVVDTLIKHGAVLTAVPTAVPTAVAIEENYNPNLNLHVANPIPVNYAVARHLERTYMEPEVRAINVEAMNVQPNNSNNNMYKNPLKWRFGGVRRSGKKTKKKFSKKNKKSLVKRISKNLIETNVIHDSKIAVKYKNPQFVHFCIRI